VLRNEYVINRDLQDLEWKEGDILRIGMDNNTLTIRKYEK
jgi:hypothetical protein